MNTNPEMLSVDGELDRCNAQAILDAAREFADPTQLPVAVEGARYVVALPIGRKLESLKPFIDELRTHPERRAGEAVLTSLEDFIKHAKRFADKDSAIFLDDTDPTQPRFISVIDYHRDGPEGGARFLEHRGVYDFPVSPEWRAWNHLSGKPVGQSTFAEFLEDHLTDVLSPDSNKIGDFVKEFARVYGVTLASPTALLEASKSLSVNVEQAVLNAVNTSTGETVVSFEEKHKDKGGGDVKLPKAFAIGIPVFRGETVYQVPVRMKYRVANQKMLFTVTLHRPDILFEHALLGALKRVAEDTQLPVFRGRPES